MSSSGAFIIDKNLGARLDETEANLPRVNADGKDVVPLTDEQKYLFDKDGWLLMPGVLSEADCAVMRAFCEQLHHDPESIPESERSVLGGPLQSLTDHPLVVGFLNEFLAYPGLSSQVCYGFRQESASLFYRDCRRRRFRSPQRQRHAALSGRFPSLSLYPGQGQLRADEGGLGIEPGNGRERNAAGIRKPQGGFSGAVLHPVSGLAHLEHLYLSAGFVDVLYRGPDAQRQTLGRYGKPAHSRFQLLQLGQQQVAQLGPASGPARVHAAPAPDAVPPGPRGRQPGGRGDSLSGGATRLVNAGMTGSKRFRCQGSYAGIWR